jgi:predicted ATP-binding protein involved in virulence
LVNKNERLIMNNSVQTVRVKSIHVKGLFGMYNHSVVLNEVERMTVIHGPNGVGKTVLFKLAQDLLAGSGVDLLKYPFEEYRIDFTNSATLRAIKNKKDNTVEVFSRFAGDETKVPINEKSFEKLAQLIENYVPIHKIRPNLWIDHETDETLNAYQVIEKYGHLLRGDIDKPFIGSLKQFRESKKYIPKVHLIEAQRLINFRGSTSRHFRETEAQVVRDTVLEYSQLLKHKINTTLAEYGKQAQKLDQTFPQRLLQQDGLTATDAEQIEKDLKNIEAKQSKYRSLGLIEEKLHSVYGLGQLGADPVKLAAMTVYLTDMNTKLDVLDPLAQRVSLLLGQINEKFTDKQLLLNKEHELAIKTSHGDEISVSALSSGEQHQIVLAYDMLFRLEPDSLVMIDEPELSLHVNWQERFLEDLKNVIEIANFDALIATHSPYVINGRHELVVSLSANEPKQERISND